jgi:uncharacterized protein
MANPKFEIFRSSKNNQYYFRLRSINGEPILSSEGYTTEQSCRNGIASVKANAPYDLRFQRNDSLYNYTFNLHASNGEIIGRSENYTTRENREGGIEAVKRDAVGAGIEERSV